MNTKLTNIIRGTVIKDENVDLTSTSGGMISYRFQRHSWITDDDRLHIMVRKNNDDEDGNMALALFSSDSVQTGRTVYTEQFGIQNTGVKEIGGIDIKSSSDGILEGDTLYLVYNTFNGDIRLGIFIYDSGSDSWSLDSSYLVFRRTILVKAQKPSIAKDSTGRIWVGFMICTLSPQPVNYESKVYYAESDDYTNWVDSQFDKDVGLDPVDEPKRSVRLLNYSTYIYAIVSSDVTFYHTFIDGPQSGTNNWAPKKTIYTIPPPVDEMEDPNRAHFSATVRVNGNQPHIQFVTNNGDNNGTEIVYASYQNDNLPIETDDVAAQGFTTLGHYPQIAQYNSGELYISYDIAYGEADQCRGLVILEKVDEGSVWDDKYESQLPGDLCQTHAARSMIPELIPNGNTIPVFQQIRTYYVPPDSIFKLVLYEVPSPTP